MIVVIADDLSGAAELAGIAVQLGLSAEVQTRFNADANAQVICLDTDSRMLSPVLAAARVTIVTREVVAARPNWIFKKCDSVLRGPVLAEARATADVCGAKQIVLVPANPSKGRTIRNGHYYIGAQPLHETEFARDLVHPRQSADVATLLGGNLGGVRVPDVQLRAGVVEVARQVDSSTLPVGAADFFTALLELRAPVRRVAAPIAPSNSGVVSLLVCGSAASWPQRKAEAEKLNIPVFEFPHDIAAVAAALRANNRALLGLGDGPGLRQVAPVQLSRELAISVVRVLQATSVPRLLLEGGDTAAAAIAAFGWTRLRAEFSSGTGVGALRPINHEATLVLVKPGSYSWPSSIWPAT